MRKHVVSGIPESIASNRSAPKIAHDTRSYIVRTYCSGHLALDQVRMVGWHTNSFCVYGFIGRLVHLDGKK
jgi:hypothetical protein